MKKILFLFLLVLIVFVIGCGKDKTTDSEQISAEVYKIDEVKTTDDDAVEEEIMTVRLCHDTDNGMVRWVNGTVFGFYDNATRFEFNDYCLNFNYLWEFYCENENPMQEIFLCINGCEDNHCL